MNNMPNDDGSYNEYVGSVHVHSTYSDGSRRPEEIAAIGIRKGLDFIILNDHDYMAKQLHLEDEGFYGRLLLLVGLEIGERYHHYLAFGLNEMIIGTGLSPQQVIDRVNAQGGFGFLAHPFEKGMPFHEKSIAYTWNDLSVKGYTGICIWNFTSRWKERIRSPFHGILFVLLKKQSLKGPSGKTLAFWDVKCRQRRVVAIGGSDAHGSRFKWGAISIVPISYDFALSSVTIHVLLPEPLSKKFHGAKAQIYEAMREGRLFIAHENLGCAKDFRFRFTGKSGTMAVMGQEIPFEKGAVEILCPLTAKIRLIRNGQIYRETRARKFSCEITEPGVYRVEAYRYLFPFGWRPWIFSNPIYIRSR